MTQACWILLIKVKDHIYKVKSVVSLIFFLLSLIITSWGNVIFLLLFNLFAILSIILRGGGSSCSIWTISLLFAFLLLSLSGKLGCKLLDSFRVFDTLNDQSYWTIICHIDVHVLTKRSWQDWLFLTFNILFLPHRYELLTQLIQELIIQFLCLFICHSTMEVRLGPLQLVIECELWHK